MASIRNEDGTVNLEGVARHVDHLKGKYAQNAKNYEANTGKKMSFKGAEGSAESDSKEDHKASEPTATEKEDAPHKSQ